MHLQPDDEANAVLDEEPLAVDQMLVYDLNQISVEQYTEQSVLCGNLYDPEDEPDDAHFEDSDLSIPPIRANRRIFPEFGTPGTEGDGTATIYTKLLEYRLLRKVTDIVLAKAGVPWNLREDATQEVHTAWAAVVANPKYEQNQLAHYAYLSGKHTALKLRRNLGAVVVIPGAMFRTGRNSPFMESIGAAVNPKDVDDYKDSLELSVDPESYAMARQRISPELLRARLAGLSLNKSQRSVAELVLLGRMSTESIASDMQVTLKYVERLLSQVTHMLYAKDEELENYRRTSPQSWPPKTLTEDQ